MDGRHDRADQEGRRRRDPQRGARRRTWHARDARGHSGAQRCRARRAHRAAHRRPLLGRDARLHGRSSGAGGGPRRPDRGDPDGDVIRSTSMRAEWTSTSTPTRSPVASRPTRSRQPRRHGRAAQVRAARRQRIRGRHHDRLTPGSPRSGGLTMSRPLDHRQVPGIGHDDSCACGTSRRIRSASRSGVR